MEQEKLQQIPQIGQLPLEYIGTAQFLELTADDLLDSSVVREKMDFIYDIYKNYLKAEKGLLLSRGEKEEDIVQKNFLEYIMELNSKIGYKPEVHPLDKIYAYLKLYGLNI